MSRFDPLATRIQRLQASVDWLKAQVEQAIDGSGTMRSTGGGTTTVGVLRTHEHGGTGEGGGTLMPKILGLKADVELTIAAGVVTVTQTHHSIDTQSDDATDDLDTINGLVANTLYVFYPANTGRTIVVKHGTGNLQCIGNSDFTLDDIHDFIVGLSPDGTTLYVMFGGGGGGAAGATGPQGPPGVEGELGEPGDPGPRGVTGATGATGPAGPAGGPMGPPGTDGEQGEDGSPGVAGAAGAVGVAGVAGSAGALGGPGTDGEQGEQGPPGLPGTQHVYRYVNVPDAAPGVVVVVGDAQGVYHLSGPVAEKAYKLYVLAKTAPGASGLPVTWQYNSSDDLDTESWTTIATYTLSSEKSNSTASMTNAVIPANRLMRVNWGTIVGSPADAQTVLLTRPVV